MRSQEPAIHYQEKAQNMFSLGLTWFPFPISRTSLPPSLMSLNNMQQVMLSLCVREGKESKAYVYQFSFVKTFVLVSVVLL